MASLDPRALVLLEVMLGVLFAVAGLAKLEERYALLRLLRDTLGLPHRLAKGVSRTLPWLELALGITLALGIAARIATMVASVLLVVFTAGLASARLRGHRRIDCGCFGPSSDSDSTNALIARNVVFLVPAVVLLASDRAPSVAWSERLVLLLLGVGLSSLPALVRGARQASRMRREIIEYHQRLLAGE